MKSHGHSFGVVGDTSPRPCSAHDSLDRPDERGSPKHAADMALSQEPNNPTEEEAQQEVKYVDSQLNQGEEAPQLPEGEDEIIPAQSEDGQETSSPACPSTYSSPRKRGATLDIEPPDPRKRHRTLLPNPHPFRERLPPSWSGMEDFVDVAHGTWVLRCGEDDWKIVIDYTAFGPERVAESAVMDLAWFLSDKGSATPDERKVAYRHFLHQFETVGGRWMMQYETLTNDIIAAAARFQTSLLRREGRGSSLCRDGPMDGDMLVLSSLRCLALCHDLSAISANLPHLAVFSERAPTDEDNWVIAEAQLAYFMGSGSDYADCKSLSPSVKAFRLPRPGNGSQPRPAPRSSKDPADTLPTLVRRTLWMAERLVAGGRPRDWPGVFYAMAVLVLVQREFEYMAHVAGCLEQPGRQFKRRLVHLMGLFLERCADWHPLNYDVDLEEFAEMVGHDTLLVEHFALMNRLWRDGIMDSEWYDDEVTDAQSFFACLDSMVYGFVSH